MTRLNENIPMTRLNDNSPLTRQTGFSDNEKGHVPDNLDPEPSSSDSSLKKSFSDLSSKKNNRDKKKNVVKTGKMTCQTHLRSTIQTRPMTVITDASGIKRRAIRKRI